jgi:hypothetical protein
VLELLVVVGLLVMAGAVGNDGRGGGRSSLQMAIMGNTDVEVAIWCGNEGVVTVGMMSWKFALQW